MAATDKLRGYYRISHRHTEAMQRRRLAEIGCEAIYSHTRDGIDRLVADLRTPRKGGAPDVVAVTSLSRLAATRDALRAAVDAIHGKGAVILEIGPKAGAMPRTSNEPAQLAAMIWDAVAEISQDRRTHSPEAAKRYGSKGGKAKAAAAAEGRTPKAEALAPWRDLSLTAEQAMGTGAMRGWTIRAAYRILGPRNTTRGVKAGRPRKSTT